MFDSETRRACWKMIATQYQEPKGKHELFDDLFNSSLRDGGLVLDLGCGDNSRLEAAKRVTHFRLIGLDCAHEALTNNSDADLKIVSDAAAVPIQQDTIDCITSRFVLEHLTNPDAVFKEVARILKPGGLFIVMTPNMFNPYVWAAKLIPNKYHSAILKAISGCADVENFPTYYRVNTATRLNKVAGRAGLVHQHLLMYQPPPYALIFSRFLCLLGIWYCRLVRRVDGLKFLRSVIIAVYRKRATGHAPSSLDHGVASETASTTITKRESTWHAG